MQKVSNAYKESMKSPLRERAFIMLSFGLINQEAQAKARVNNGEFAYFSNKDNVLGQHTDDFVYATLEENFTRVDGSMYFLPREETATSFYDTGIIGKELVSDKIYELNISLNTVETDIKGITINFGENYPVDFDVVGSTGQTIEYRGNTLAEFTMEDVLVQTTSIKLVFYKMKNPKSRLRIYSIRFGYGLVYYNDSVMDSTLESYISPIGADVPQIDFSVQLKNYDKYFNVDNPKSAINFLETGQEMEIYYGYQLPGTDTIEWIMGNHLLCSEWESDDYTATIRCQDVFRNMDSEYSRGQYKANGISYYDLAETVILDAGETNYYIDPRLKKIFTKNPIPKVKHKEALQIIANACRCTLTQTRQGYIQIKSNFIPESTIACNGEAPYSNIQNVMSDTAKEEYGSFATNYTAADGGMFLLPKNDSKGGRYTGYVSDVQSGADGTFTKNPVITVTQESACLYYGVRLVFGNALPEEFVIRTTNNGIPVTELTVSGDDIQKNTVVLHDFDDFDVMEIEFTKTKDPYNRIVLNHFSFGDIADFTMTRRDMTSSPKAIKQELIKEVIVPCYSYQNGTQEDNLLGEELTVKPGDIQTFYVGEPCYGYRLTVNGSSSGATIVESGSYFITVKFSVSGTVKLEILGYRYKIVERYAIVPLNSRGKSIKWENPLISDMDVAEDLAKWLSDYYRSGIEYEYDTRGNPEIDANDIIYQENEFHDNMKVNVYRHTIHFKQAFSGKVVARRQGG